jgi:hypothetical protein
MPEFGNHLNLGTSIKNIVAEKYSQVDIGHQSEHRNLYMFVSLVRRIRFRTCTRPSPFATR